MGKIASLDISESLIELKELVSKQTTLKGEKRVKSLIYIKTKKFKTRQEVAASIGVHIRTLERWVETYKLFGIDQMISDKPKNNRIIVERPSTATSIIKAIIPSTISACGKFCIIKSIQTSLGVNLYFACLNY